MRPTPRRILALLAPCLFFTALGAQDASSGSSVLDMLNKAEPISFSGTLASSAGGAIGWPLNPIRTKFENTDQKYGYTLSDTLAFDARPDPDFRVHGSFAASYPGYYFSTSELFFDYSINDTIFLRGGKQGIGWGNSRVFGAGDLMSAPVVDASLNRTSAGISLKAYAPFGANGLTFVALAPSTSDPSSVKPSFAGKFDLAFGKFEVTEEAVILGDRSVDFSFFAKTSVLDIDIFGQAYGSLGEWSGKKSTVSGLTGAYWEASDPQVKAYVEYWINGESSYPDDHRLALGLGWTLDESAGVKLAFLWTHAFWDASGTLMPAIVYQPRSHVSFYAAALASYGDIGSIYASPTQTISSFSWSEKYSLFLKVDFSLDY